jgi:hypothetical protein
MLSKGKQFLLKDILQVSAFKIVLLQIPNVKSSLSYYYHLVLENILDQSALLVEETGVSGVKLPICRKSLIRVITVFTVFWFLTDFVCLYTYEFPFVRGRFGALKSDSTHHFFRNACTKSGSLRCSQFSGC